VSTAPDGLDFEGFRALAQRADLSPNERVGFPDAVRAGREEAIADDIARKLDLRGLTIDIGCGAGPVAAAVHGRVAGRLVLVDSAEMLAALPDAPNATKVAARFPDCPDLLAEHEGAARAVLAYSVLQYVFAAGDAFRFVDAACSLLAPGGRLLLGDLPNASMRRRFLASEAGREHHRRHYGPGEPEVRFNAPTPGELDDATVLALAQRARSAGLHAWVVPQPSDLPMANRREDLLIQRP
jgi:hypothetical protein